MAYEQFPPSVPETPAGRVALPADDTISVAPERITCDVTLSDSSRRRTRANAPPSLRATTSAAASTAGNIAMKCRTPPISLSAADRTRVARSTVPDAPRNSTVMSAAESVSGSSRSAPSAGRNVIAPSAPMLPAISVARVRVVFVTTEPANCRQRKTALHVCGLLHTGEQYDITS